MCISRTIFHRIFIDIVDFIRLFESLSCFGIFHYRQLFFVLLQVSCNLWALVQKLILEIEKTRFFSINVVQMLAVKKNTGC